MNLVLPQWPVAIHISIKLLKRWKWSGELNWKRTWHNLDASWNMSPIPWVWNAHKLYIVHLNLSIYLLWDRCLWFLKCVGCQVILISEHVMCVWQARHIFVNLNSHNISSWTGKNSDAGTWFFSHAWRLVKGLRPRETVSPCWGHTSRVWWRTGSQHSLFP